MTEKQQQLTFNKGITNVPSDAICSDNTLSESIGMVYDNGEHRVIQKPVEYITSAVDIDGTTAISLANLTLLYVHKFNDQERFIASQQTNSHGTVYYIIVYGVKDGSVLKKKGGLFYNSSSLVYNRDYTKISTIGKTLVISDNNGLHYFLWTYNTDNYPTYEPLGDSFPRPEVEFKLTGRNDTDSQGKEINVARDSVKCNGTIYDHNGAPDIVLGKQSDWNNAAVGLYSKLKKTLSKKKLFYGSFCVRVALELYDGTYFHVSNPIFMVNHFSTYGMGSISGYSSGEPLLGMEIFGQELQYKFSQDYTKWSDIVKSIVLFVTDQAELNDTTLDAKIKTGSASVKRSYFMSDNNIYHDSRSTDVNSGTPGSDQLPNDWYIIWEPKPDSDLSDTIKEGVYYKLCEIGMVGDDSWHNAGEQFDSHTIENITTQTQLGEDDYYSHCPIKADMVYSYNSRLNLAGVLRGFFGGFDFFMPFDGSGTPPLYTFLVTIRTDSGDIVVSHSKETNQKQGIYFYYPDSRAIHVVIKKNDTQILNADLTEHPTLNGAYFFAGISPTMEEPSSSSGDIPAADNTKYEPLPNYIIQSEVNNPLVFKAAGYFKVGTGKILGMSSITQALSEGQFGQYPLLVFSESGIWALSVASTGYYSSIQPMSREVCNNIRSITQTDGAVFFTSEKGLMVVLGNQVKCVSEQLLGREDPFAARKYPTNRLGSTNAFFRNCHIAYDYRDSLLWLFSNSSAANSCYVYSIKNGTFGKFEMATTLNAVNNYPDYLIQVPSEGNKVYSLLNRPSIDSDTGTYDASMLSRPMKLENALALKSIMQAKHIRDFKPYTVTNNGTSATTSGATEFYIYASNNLNDWVQLTSLRGVPWKYYRFGYKFTGLKAVDRFAGTIVITQERRTDKLR